MQGKKKSEAMAADKKMNVALTQHDSIFPNIKLPGGISSKATEYKELAAKGDKWESPVFSIGSGSKTRNIPALGEVQRKYHHVTEGGVRDPHHTGHTAPISTQNRDPGAQYSTQQGSGLNGNAYSANGRANGNTASALSNQVDQAFSKVPQGQNVLDQTNPILSGSAPVDR